MGFSADTHEARIQAVREEMGRQGVGAMFLPASADLLYLTGIPRGKPGPTRTIPPGGWARGVLLTADKAVYLCPRLSSLLGLGAIESKQWIDDILIVEEVRDLPGHVRDLVAPLLGEVQKLAVPETTTADTVLQFAQLFPGLRVVSTESLVGRLRRIKEPEEVEFMRKASRIADKAFTDMLDRLEIGMTEGEITAEVESLMTQHGASGLSFYSGIMIRGPQVENLGGAGGGRERPFTLSPGDTLSFDIGCVYEDYCSDFGRTVYVGSISEEIRRVHELVMEAQAAGIAAMVAHQATCAQVDHAARSVIEQAGHGEGFLHRLGHAIGLDVHEPPFLTHTDDTVLRPGMTFTVEPSIFVPGHGYVRTEDVLLVTDEGTECLNKTTREPLVVC